ncbi:hypothetical protein IQ06DRAFT_73431 [Phaeosphaeriaceae sp. SRC1lsM3a]|nr:hypothetical protein IQ06DRAFT_73431 [Stagonospora sp. SRC1lsM3a]
MNSKISPRIAIDGDYVSSKLRRCALVEHVARQYYDKTPFPESDESNTAAPHRIYREYRYRRLHCEAGILNDDIHRHIYPYAAQECRAFCEAMHDTLPQELRDIVYDLLYDMMRPVPKKYEYDNYGMLNNYLAPLFLESEHAHIGDVAFMGERTLLELALQWSSRSTIIVTEGWQWLSLAEVRCWDDTSKSRECNQYVIVKATYPVAKHGQDFSRLESDLAVLRQFQKPLNVLIDWDTRAIIYDKIRTADTSMIEYFENIVDLCPSLRPLLEAGNTVRMSFRNGKRPFVVRTTDFVGNALVSKAYAAPRDPPSVANYIWGHNNTSWVLGSHVYLPQVLHGLC